MAKKYTCDACSHEMMADRETKLVERVREHVRSEHNTNMEAEEIRQGIEDT